MWEENYNLMELLSNKFTYRDAIAERTGEIEKSLTDIELICVDDGSTDSSLSILNALAENDDRIRVFSQKNHF